MLISHELPLSLQYKAREWNDYDYCLPHLLDKHESYREYFLKARADDRHIIMDNGLFEGVTHTIDDLVEKINLIEPDIFIVPDAWNGMIVTKNNVDLWVDSIASSLPKRTKLMVVLQGTTVTNIEYLYRHCEIIGLRHFAFNHSSVTYQYVSSHTNKLVNQMLGRISLITQFYKNKTIAEDHYIHLLGASLPQEFMYYDGYKINSVDTSNPIIYGAYGSVYKEGGILSKPNSKIETFMESAFSRTQLQNIEFNVEQFRKYCRPSLF